MIHSEWNELRAFVDIPPHPNVLPLLGICTDFKDAKKSVCFVTDYIERGSLRELMLSTTAPYFCFQFPEPLGDLVASAEFGSSSVSNPAQRQLYKMRVLQSLHLERPENVIKMSIDIAQVCRCLMSLCACVCVCVRLSVCLSVFVYVCVSLSCFSLSPSLCL